MVRSDNVSTSTGNPSELPERNMAESPLGNKVTESWQEKPLNPLVEVHAGAKLEEGESSASFTRWFLFGCKFALWLSLWALFIELQFGAVFFTLSLILFTYVNTRTGPRDERLSAYSVFNRDCQRIQGTLTAEQMQRNMFGVPGVTS